LVENDNRHNDTLDKDTLKNDNQHIGLLRHSASMAVRINDIQHNKTQHNDPQRYGSQYIGPN